MRSSWRASSVIVAILTIAAATSCSAWIPATTRTTASIPGSRTNPRIPTLVQLNAIKTDEELLPIVREAIAEKEATQEWNDCVEFLTSELELSSGGGTEAEILLSLALEWRGWARVTSELARKYMKPKLPNLQQLQTSLEWLKTGPLALSDTTTLTNAVKSSPQTYLMDPEGSYQMALETAPKPYKDPTIFHQMLLEDPTILECSYNCVDDGCASECGNCWVSYEIKNGKGSAVPDPFV